MLDFHSQLYHLAKQFFIIQIGLSYWTNPALLLYAIGTQLAAAQEMALQRKCCLSLCTWWLIVIYISTQGFKLTVTWLPETKDKLRIVTKAFYLFDFPLGS